MNVYLKYGITIAVFAGFSGFLLSSVNQFTSSRIKEYQQKVESSGQKEVLPQASNFISTQNKSITFKIGVNEKQQPVGYVIKASGTGYSSTIETLIGLDNDLKITGIKILNQQETPGLGTKITEINSGASEPWFQSQFRSRSYKQLSLKANGGQLDGITGATISSKAVVDSVKNTILSFKDSLITVNISTPEEL